jgi:general secretion pathway protein G
MKRTAFTLIEILIVVILLGILAAIVIPQFTDTSEQAEDTAAASVESTLNSQTQLYKFRYGTLPGDAGDLVDAELMVEEPDATRFTVAGPDAQGVWTVTAN